MSKLYNPKKDNSILEDKDKNIQINNYFDQNKYIKEQNKILKSIITNINKNKETIVNENTEKKDFAIKEELFHYYRKINEIDVEIDEFIEFNNNLNKSIKLIESFIENKSSINDIILKQFKDVNDYFNTCNFIMTVLINKKDDIKKENIEIIKKIVNISNSYCIEK